MKDNSIRAYVWGITFAYMFGMIAAFVLGFVIGYNF
jgi:hypothetical protein